MGILGCMRPDTAYGIPLFNRGILDLHNTEPVYDVLRLRRLVVNDSATSNRA